MPFTNPLLFGGIQQGSLVKFGARGGEPQGNDYAGTVTILNDPGNIFDGVDNSGANFRGAVIRATGTYKCTIKENYTSSGSTPGGANTHLTGLSFGWGEVNDDGTNAPSNWYANISLYTLGTDTFTANGTSADIVVDEIDPQGSWFGTKATFFGAGFSGSVGPSLVMEIKKIS